MCILRSNRKFESKPLINDTIMLIKTNRGSISCTTFDLQFGHVMALKDTFMIWDIITETDG